MLKHWFHTPVLGLVGLSKNAGKTTLMNALLKAAPWRVAITSVGLDGERYDQLTSLPKPRIYVTKGTLVLTAEATLTEATATFKTLEILPITTALGTLMLLEVTRPGTVLLAGPTTTKTLECSLKRLKTYVDYVLVDGALNRKSFIHAPSIDGVMLAVGASYHESQDVTVHAALTLAEQLQFEQTKQPSWMPVRGCVGIASKTTYQSTTKAFDTLCAWHKHDPSLHTVYVKGAFSKRFSDALVHARIKHLCFVLDDATKLLIDPKRYTYLKQLGHRFEVVHPMCLVAVSINPYHVGAHHYDEATFTHALSTQLSCPVYNVLKEYPDANKTQA